MPSWTALSTVSFRVRERFQTLHKVCVISVHLKNTSVRATGLAVFRPPSGLEKSIGLSVSQEERFADLYPSGRAEGTDPLDPPGTQPTLSRAIDRTSPSQATCWLARERAGDTSHGALVRFTLSCLSAPIGASSAPQEVARLAGGET
jgi:hypothetical protein